MSISSGGQRGLRGDGGAAMLLDGRAFGQGFRGCEGLLTYYMVRPIQPGRILVQYRDSIYDGNTRIHLIVYGIKKL